MAYLPGVGFVNNPESALVVVPKEPPTLTPSTAEPSNSVTNGGGHQSLTSNYTVAPRARRQSEKVADDNLIDLEGLGPSLDR